MSEEKKDKLTGDVAMRSPILVKLENFWYHHKWSFVFGVLALVVLVVSLVQCAGNGKGDDAAVMYAGGYSLMGTVGRDFESTIKDFSEDRNGDGKIVVGIGNYAIYTNDEIAAKFPDTSTQAQVKQATYNNRQAFDQEILAGEASLCFLSPTLFEAVAKDTLKSEDGLISRLMPVSEYYSGATADDLVSYGGVAYGIKLSSLAISTYPGFSELPEDTILCMRSQVSMNTIFGGKSAERMHEANLALVKRLLAAEPYSAR